YLALPVVAALRSGLGAALVGNSPMGVRALFLVLGAAIPIVVYWLARPLSSRTQALEAAALSLCLPLAAFLGLLAVPDVPLLFFGLLLIGCLERATRLGAEPKQSLKYWALCGIAAALGISTHYRFSLYVLAAFIALAVFKELHIQWRKP